MGQHLSDRKPTSRISVAAMFLPACLSPQYTKLGGVAFSFSLLRA